MLIQPALIKTSLPAPAQPEAPLPPRPARGFASAMRKTVLREKVAKLTADLASTELGRQALRETKRQLPEETPSLQEPLILRPLRAPPTCATFELRPPEPHPGQARGLAAAAPTLLRARSNSTKRALGSNKSVAASPERWARSPEALPSLAGPPAGADLSSGSLALSCSPSRSKLAPMGATSEEVVSRQAAAASAQAQQLVLFGTLRGTDASIPARTATYPAGPIPPSALSPAAIRQHQPMACLVDFTGRQQGASGSPSRGATGKVR